MCTLPPTIMEPAGRYLEDWFPFEGTPSVAKLVGGRVAAGHWLANDHVDHVPPASGGPGHEAIGLGRVGRGVWADSEGSLVWLTPMCAFSFQGRFQCFLGLVAIVVVCVAVLLFLTVALLWFAYAWLARLKPDSLCGLPPCGRNPRKPKWIPALWSAYNLLHPLVPFRM